jgi:programmed cell death protein 6
LRIFFSNFFFIYIRAAQQSQWYNQYGQQVQNGQSAEQKAQLVQLQQFWARADRDKSGSISAAELASLPLPGQSQYGGKPIGPAVATSLIGLFDADKSGHIEWNEFTALFGWLNAMTTAFARADADHGGTLDAREIGGAIRGAGFEVSDFVLGKYFHKYSYGRQELNFLQYMLCVADLAKIRSVFAWHDTNREGKIDLDRVFSLVADVTAQPVGDALLAHKVKKDKKDKKKNKKTKKKGGKAAQAAAEGVECANQ